MDVHANSPQTSSDSPGSRKSKGAAKSDQVEFPDQIPGGRYHLVERLSTGAIGAVYKALDTILDRPVAVKCVRLDTPFADHSPDELRERFVREARIAARLQHPNIVTIHDIVATANRGYIIMEFIECRTLESLIESEGRLPMSSAIHIVSQLASALDYAHERNVVHRDVKPANILVSPSMYVWVTDFGIAKSELSTNLTMAGGVLGTPDYMSPEQAKGEDVDARSDLFSLGCILFEAVVGDKPFRSPSLTGVLLSIINDEPVFPLNWRSLGLPTELKPILHHALEKTREKRYATGSQLMAALEAIPKTAIEAADAGVGRAMPADAGQARDEAQPETSEARAEPPAPPLTPAEAPDGPAAELEDGAAEGPAADTTEETASHADETEEASAESEVSEVASEPEATEDAAEEMTAANEEAAEDETAAAAEEPAETEAVAAAAADTAEGDDAPAAETDVDASEVADGVSHAADAEEPEGAAGDHETEPDEQVTASNGVEEPVEEEEAETDADTTAAEAESEETESLASDTVEVEEEKELERTTTTAEQIREMKEESQVLHLSPTLSGDLHGVEITPEEGFLLSRIDGASRPNDIISVSPMAEADTVRALLDLLGKGLIRLGGVTREPVTPKAPAPTPPPRLRKRPDDATVKEVDRLLALAESEDYPELLDLPATAPEAKRKSAYLKIVAKFHPDKFSHADAAFREKLSKLCASASEAVSEFEKSVKAKEAAEANARRQASLGSNGGPEAMTGPNGSSPAFDKRRYARELYDRARSAFDNADYWEAIQLGRQAVEADGQEAEFYGLLGKALLQNKKWRKEAADCFLKASQLEPDNIDYVGMLGAIYHHEGLVTRAKTLLDRAKAIDPDYEFPELSETEVATG